jgi:uncharacterized protein
LIQFQVMTVVSAARPDHVLIAGVSTRAAAASAARAGFRVTTLDAFADRDQDPRVRALSLPRDVGTRFTATAAARAARGVECDAVAYLSSFENYPRAIATLAAGRVLWGNPPPIIQRARDPRLVADVLRRRGFATPDLAAEDLVRGSYRDRWLMKPLKSGGGHRIRPWSAARQLVRGCYLQERIDGISGSAIFVAARGRAVLLGISRQLVGDAAFGAGGYRYCGNILSTAWDEDPVIEAGEASALVSAVAEEFGVVGVNGLDFVARRGVPYVLEINPRWSASMELVERAFGLSAFGTHAAACTSGGLPEFDFCADRSASVIGKAILFARRDVTVGDTNSWLGDDTIHDVPHPGDRIRTGHPVCTIFAAGRDAAACYAALVERADALYEQLAEWSRRGA